MNNHPNITEDLFRICGITTNDPVKVRNDELLKNIINYVKDKLVHEELLDDEDPLSCV